VRRAEQDGHVLAKRALHPQAAVHADRARQGDPLDTPLLRDRHDVEDAVERRAGVVDRRPVVGAEVVAREVDDAGDRVARADRAEGGEVGDVAALGRDGEVGQVRGHVARAALHEQDLLAQLVESADGVGTDEAGSAGDENHGRPFV
jgi:hypothetical protein